VILSPHGLGAVETVGVLLPPVHDLAVIEILQIVFKIAMERLVSFIIKVPSSDDALALMSIRTF